MRATNVVRWVGAMGSMAAWVVATVVTTPVFAALPAGWTVHTFTGRVAQIEAAGGVLACATDGGLLFFDRATQTFAPAIADAGCTDGQCLTSNQLTCVARDATGGYWLGTVASGAVVFRPGDRDRTYGRFFVLNTSPGGGLLADSVSCIEVWRDQTVYAGTSRGVAQIDLAAGIDSYNEDASRRLERDLKGTLIHDLAVDSLNVWVATDSGVSRFDRRPPYTTTFLPDSLTGRETYSLEILAGTVYAGTGVGLFSWNEAGHYWRRVRNTTGPPTPNFKVESIARLANGRLFVGSTGTVQTFNGFLWGPLAPPGIYLLGDRRFPTCIATGDTLWTCQVNDQGEGGFLDTWSVSDPNWRHFEPNSIPTSEVRAVGLGPQRELWIGTRLAGVARLNTLGNWCIWNANSPEVRANMSDGEGHVSMLLAARNGRTWFAPLPQPLTSAVVDILDPDATCSHPADGWSHVQPGALGFAGRYWRAEQDGEGNIFLLADGEPGDSQFAPHGGMDIISEDGTHVANLRADIVGGSSVGALAFETTNGAWSRAYVGLNGLLNHGLRRWNRSGQLFPPTLPDSLNFVPLALPDTFGVAQYRDIVVVPGSPRTLWVGTDNGIFEYDVNAQRILTQIHTRVDAGPGLLSGDIKDLQFDDAGNLWVASIKGLNRVRLVDRVTGQVPPVDAFTTIEIIRELNDASAVGQLYDPRKSLAPLPAPKVNALAYDTTRHLLYIGSEAGVAILDVPGFNPRPVIPLDKAVLWPNPVRIDAGHQQVRLANVSEPATVTIYTLEGQIVCEVTDREDGDVVWNLTTPSCLDSFDNFRVASGLYPVRITTSAGTTIRTLVVVR